MVGPLEVEFLEMIIKVSNQIFLKDVPNPFWDALTERLSFVNPQWIENDRMGRWNGQTPRGIRCYEMMDDGRTVIPGALSGSCYPSQEERGLDGD